MRRAAGAGRRSVAGPWRAVRRSLGAARRSPRTRAVGDALRAVTNVLRHGPRAPRPHERFWVDPSVVRSAFAWFPAQSGRVVRSWPPAARMPLEDHPHVRLALAHWRDGLSWEDAGAYTYLLERIAERGQQDGCRTREEVLDRYRRLDETYREAEREGRLRVRQEVVPGARGEQGGILVHLGPGGEVVSGDSGKHRLVLAQLLGLPAVPVELGLVHRSALGRLPDLRRPPDGEVARLEAARRPRQRGRARRPR